VCVCVLYIDVLFKKLGALDKAVTPSIQEGLHGLMYKLHT